MSPSRSPQHGDDDLANPIENSAPDASPATAGPATVTPDHASPEAGELAHRIVEVASDKKAVDIVMLRTAELTTMADYFVICSGRSERQVSALSQAILDQLREDGVRPIGVEGLNAARWVLADFGSVIVHVFAPEERDYYGLERLWSNAAQVVRVV